MSADIINKLISGYTASTTNIQVTSAAIGMGLFNTLATIGVAWLGLNHLLKRHVDMTDANIELIKLLVYLNFFYLFIVHYQDINKTVFGGIQEIGNALGAKAGGGATVDINPGSIINLGFQICKELFSRLITFNLLRSLAIVIVIVLAAAVVMVSFTIIAIDLIIIQIGSQIILAGGVFLLAFSGLPWTREYAERYVHTFFHLGIRIIFMYILVGIGALQAREWAQQLDSAPGNQLFDSVIAVMVCAFIYCRLCNKLPDHAVSYLTGRLPMTYDTASTLKAAVTAAFSIPKKAAEIAKTATGVATGIQGNAMAYDMAKQSAAAYFQAQGKTPTPQELYQETIKTLGEARKEVRQAAKDKKIDDTFGGKVAAKIVDNVPNPVPKAKETK